MTEVVFTKNAEGKLEGFTSSGHAGFRRYGKDIVCASISVLTLNTINSMERFTDRKCIVDSDERSGFLSCMIQEPDDSSELLMKSLLGGLQDIQEQYGSKYCKVTIKERKQC